MHGRLPQYRDWLAPVPSPEDGASEPVTSPGGVVCAFYDAELRSTGDQGRKGPLISQEKAYALLITVRGERAEAAGTPTPADLKRKNLRVSSDLRRHVGWIEADLALGRHADLVGSDAAYRDLVHELYDEMESICPGTSTYNRSANLLILSSILGQYLGPVPWILPWYIGLKSNPVFNIS